VSRLYVVDLTANELHFLDTTTGSDPSVGACTPVSGQMWTGATGTADGTLCASTASGTISYLYQVDTTSGATTMVGEITNASCIIDIAINTAGEMYGVDTCSDVLERSTRPQPHVDLTSSSQIAYNI
jgi:osmotically-inducible protein OsmY